MHHLGFAESFELVGVTVGRWAPAVQALVLGRRGIFKESLGFGSSQLYNANMSVIVSKPQPFLAML